MRLALIKLPMGAHLSSHPPLGITYLASYIIQHNIIEPSDICLCDLDLVLRNAYFDGLDILHLSKGELLKLLADTIAGLNCEIIGFTVYNHNVRLLSDIVKEIRDKIPDSIIIIGGPFPTLFPKMALKYTGADYAVIGEGEQTLYELLNYLATGKPKLNRIRGIAYVDKEGNIKLNPRRELISNLDKIPFPAFDLLPLDEYWEFDYFPSLPLITSRGCPYQCTFCSERIIWGKTVRFRSIKNVIDEIERDIYDFGVREILFYDSTFTLNRDRTINLLKEIINRRLNDEVRFFAQTRIDCIDKKLLELMKQGGFAMITFGVETVIKSSIVEANKGYPHYIDVINHIKELVKHAIKLGLYVNVNFIIGFPSETKDELLKELQLIKELRQYGAIPRVHLLNPEGELLNKYKDELISNPTYYREFSSPLEGISEPIPEIDSDYFIIPPKNLSIDEYVSLFEEAMFISGSIEPAGIYL
ncbi:MAG TPA: B12-binding domain-containing radical SAM protein [Thermococcaceae archaeon]|uniref:B12-binding domain-containing radical SAM protein n=1 Tax=Thermococcus sp. PK TaxID=913025 RepID=UPI0005B284C3|nr:B12-binding domain-containing radical SAM protein [Thermococcus sp. PK]HIH72526.1 B12-binding domain-containing radical SAM protein [Thermococcaceae archaeon]HII68036.1 B12-binding domain-containing radical SAM protein [Thermococcaceae archaeon]